MRCDAFHYFKNVMDLNVQLEHSENALSQGYSLHWYQIDRVIGHGGFGITYLAHDKNLGRPVAIKEYMPEEFAVRGKGYSIQPKVSDKHGLYKWGLDRFISEARILAQFNHPNIIRVLSVFEENNTAYMIMEYAQGRDLSKIFKSEGVFGQEQLLDIFIPIIDGLALVHNEHFIHRDIKPANIYINTDQKPVLIDFGSARQSISEKSKTLTNILTYGYAPYEQYSEDYGVQGPWTDIYSLGACLYVGITGKKPLDALSRGGGLLKDGLDPYEPVSLLQKNNYEDSFLLAIDNALMFKAEQRPQDVLTWARMLLGEIQAPPLPTFMGKYTQSDDDKTRIKPRRSGSLNTDPSYNSQGLVDRHGKRNTNPTWDLGLSVNRKTKPTLDIRLSKGPKGNKKSRYASKIMMFVILVLVIGAIIVVGQSQFELNLRDLVVNFAGEKKPDKSAVDIADKNSETKSLDMKRNKVNSVISGDSANTDIDKLLRKAVLLFSQEKYIQPENNSALYYYRKVLTMDPDNVAAAQGLRKLEAYLTEAAIETFNNDRLTETKYLLDQLTQLNPESKTALELRLKIANLEKAKDEIESLLSQAKILLQKKHFTTPENDNAYTIYQQILIQDPGNDEALKGIQVIQDYYVHQFDQHVQYTSFEKAEKDLKILAGLNLTLNQIKDMEKILSIAKSRAEKEIPKEDAEISRPIVVTMDQVSQMLGSFKTLMESQQYKELNQISQYSAGRQQFVEQLFAQYKSMKVHISNVKFIPMQNKASAQIIISDLIENNGYQVVPGAWSQFEINMSLDHDQQLKIYW